MRLYAQGCEGGNGDVIRYIERGAEKSLGPFWLKAFLADVARRLREFYPPTATLS